MRGAGGLFDSKVINTQYTIRTSGVQPVIPTYYTVQYTVLYLSCIVLGVLYVYEPVYYASANLNLEELTYLSVLYSTTVLYCTVHIFQRERERIYKILSTSTVCSRSEVNSSRVESSLRYA